MHNINIKIIKNNFIKNKKYYIIGFKAMDIKIVFNKH